MAARGFLNAQHTTGGAPKVTEYPLASGQAIKVGQPVKLVNGEITKATAITDQIIGIAAADSTYGENEFTTSLVDDSSVDYNKCRVYDDLANTIFVAEATHATAVTASMIGKLYAIGLAATSGGRAVDFVDTDLVAATAVVVAKILGLYETSDTTLTPAWGGTAAKVLVQLLDVDSTTQAVAVPA